MSTPAVSPRPAAITMYATYAVCAVGLAIGFSTVFDSHPDLRWATLLAVGGGGILSYIRHSLLHRSDGVRLGWDIGRTNPFQIEVGFANLSWGIVAVLAAVLDWGLAVESATFLVFGIYMSCVTVFLMFGMRTGTRPLATIIPTIAFAAMLMIVGIAGMSAAT